MVHKGDFRINQRVIVEGTGGKKGKVVSMWDTYGGDPMYRVELETGETMVRCEPYLTFEDEVRPNADVEIGLFYAFRYYRNGSFDTSKWNGYRYEDAIRFSINDRVLVLDKDWHLDIDVIKEPMLLSMYKKALDGRPPGQHEMDESDCVYLKSIPFIGVYKTDLARPVVNIWYFLFIAFEAATAKLKRVYLRSAERKMKRIAKRAALDEMRRRIENETEIKDGEQPKG